MANKVTNKQKYEALIALVKANGITISNGEDTVNTDGMIQWLESRIEGLEKKSSKSSEKVDKEQAEVDENVLSVVDHTKQKVSEIMEKVNAECGVKYTSSRVTASLGRLKAKGDVINIVEKKNSYYTLAE